jgi:hypothetical protein
MFPHENHQKVDNNESTVCNKYSQNIASACTSCDESRFGSSISDVTENGY